LIYCVAPRKRKAGLGGPAINISSVGGQSIGDASDHPNTPYHAGPRALDLFYALIKIEWEMTAFASTSRSRAFHSDLVNDLPPCFIEHIDLKSATTVSRTLEIGVNEIFLPPCGKP
jgi:hypothetical protein